MTIDGPINFGIAAWFSLQVYDRMLSNGWSAFGFCLISLVIVSAIGAGITRAVSDRRNGSGRVKLR